MTANTFDFSTSQEVDLIVDYSDFEIYGPVKFSIYSTNPIVNENDYNEYVDESIEPIFEAYTDSKGKFDETITLPAYAKVLHIVTGNFMIGLTRKAVEVVKGEARLKLENNVAAAPAVENWITRAPGAGVETNDLSVLPWLSYNFKSGGGMNDRVYKNWHTPLGTWNSATGRPSYLLSSSTFSGEEMAGLYATACNALNSGTTCKEDYRASADLTLIMDSEVSIAALGSMTCWNSSFGYYYYKGENPPTKRTDLNIIMLFPNTQDGHRYTPKFGSGYQNNIGMVRGDMIQLMYYPNIANGSYSGATTVFPKGTKIGFILKPGGWGNQGNEYCTKNGNSLMSKKMNIWAASTEGMSYCNQDMGSYKFPNTTGEARTAKFAYISPSGDAYSIVSVEDACDDKDYDDLLFALNPANVFKELPTVEVGKTTKHGVYAFEDRWPGRGDYDMNGVLFAIGAAVCQGVGLVLSKIGMDHYELSADMPDWLVPFSANFYRCIAGIIGFGLLLYFREGMQPLREAMHDRKGLSVATATTIFGPFVGVGFSLMAVQYTAAGIASTLMAMTPIIILLPSYWLFHEKITWRAVLGAIISVIGVSLFFQ